MKTEKNKKQEDNLRAEYELSKMEGCVRGKYAKRYRAGTNLVLLSPDVAHYFKDEKSVNSAQRSLVELAKSQVRHAV